MNCPTRPRLADFLKGNYLFDSWDLGVFRTPADSAAAAWSDLVRHPLTPGGGTWHADALPYRCATGADTYGAGLPVPSLCRSTTGAGLQQANGQAAWADYQARVEAFYAAYAEWLAASSPDFLDRLECYSRQDL